MPCRRRLPAPLVVLLAVAALAAVAVAPRGLLRAVVADELAIAEQVEGTALSAPADAPELPGVRALVAREEDGAELVLAPADPVATAPADVALSSRPVATPPPADEPAPPAPSLRSIDGERAPPRPI
ncbi:MAG: hypothetical protein ACLGIC_11080 [Acidimicrobiia bacterium]